MYTPIGKSDLYTVNGSKRWTMSEVKSMGYRLGDEVPVEVEEKGGVKTYELLELLAGDGARDTRAVLMEVDA